MAHLREVAAIMTARTALWLHTALQLARLR